MRKRNTFLLGALALTFIQCSEPLLSPELEVEAEQSHARQMQQAASDAEPSVHHAAQGSLRLQIDQLQSEFDRIRKEAIHELYRSLPSGFDSYTFPTVGELQSSMGLPPEWREGDSIAWNGMQHRNALYEIGAWQEEPFDLPGFKPGLRERFLEGIMHAYYNGEISELAHFISSDAMLPYMLPIERKYDLAGVQNRLAEAVQCAPPISESAVDVSNYDRRDGDIYVKRDASSSKGSNGSSSSGSNLLGVFIPGKWQHAAFMDTKQRRFDGPDRCLLSASDETDEARSDGGTPRVGYDRFSGYWNLASEVGIYRVVGASENERIGAIQYARQFLGARFCFVTGRMSNSTFYCSKLVYRGWLSQGYELEPHHCSFTGLPWIKYPCRVYWDYRWVKIGRFFRFKVWYLVVEWRELPDCFVTPTDLVSTSDTRLITRYVR